MGIGTMSVTCQTCHPVTSTAMEIELQRVVYSALRRARRDVVKAQNDYYRLTGICDNRPTLLTGPFAQKNQHWLVSCIVWQIDLYERWQTAEIRLEMLAMGVAMGSHHEN